MGILDETKVLLRDLTRSSRAYEPHPQGGPRSSPLTTSDRVTLRPSLTFSTPKRTEHVVLHSPLSRPPPFVEHESSLVGAEGRPPVRRLPSSRSFSSRSHPSRLVTPPRCPVSPSGVVTPPRCPVVRRHLHRGPGPRCRRVHVRPVSVPPLPVPLSTTPLPLRARPTPSLVPLNV